LADLDCSRFAKREAATRALVSFGPQAEAAVRQAVHDARSLEMRRRLNLILDKMDCDPLPGTALRELRAVEILEHIGTPEAKVLLQMLAAGAGDARMTSDARAALRRLGPGTGV
jgi:hypothetical protein